MSPGAIDEIDWQAPLAPIFAGDFAYLRGALVRDGGGRRVVEAAALRDPAVLEPTLSLFARLYPRGGRAGVVSLWSQWYFGLYLTPLVLSALALGRGLPADPAELGVVLEGDGTPAAFLVADAGKAGVDPALLFETLACGHVEPLAAALAAAGGFSRRVAWSNAGNVFEWAVGEAERRHGVPPDNAGRAVVGTRVFAGGRRNVLFDPVRVVDVDGAPLRRRRVCCLRYQVPDFGWCENCPTPGRAAAAADAAA
jgi:ferric iron reductase protein FhuF